MAAFKRFFFPQHHDSFNMFPAFPGRPRCPTEKPWVRPTGGLAGVNRREGSAGELAMEKADLAGVVQRSQLVYMLIP